jgi:hypothetical protein
MGIEPTSEAWEASILPLNYARSDWERDDSTTWSKAHKTAPCSNERSELESRFSGLEIVLGMTRLDAGARQRLEIFNDARRSAGGTRTA